MAAARKSLAGRRLWLWAVALPLGLAVRLFFLDDAGTQDMLKYAEWGHRVVDEGLGDAYTGIYFPFQWLLFALTVMLGDGLGISDTSAIKLVNLAFDLGSLGLLVVLLGTLRLPREYALVYWVHPFFMAIAWLGYIDMQVGFFILLAVIGLARARTDKHLVLAGIPLGLTFVMKPQADFLVVMLVLSAVGAWFLGKRFGLAGDGRTTVRNTVLVLIPGAVFYVAFSLLVWVTGGPIGKLLLTNTPQVLEAEFPALNGNMLNPSMLVALGLREPGTPTYSVVEPSILNQLSSVLTIGLLAGAVVLLLRRVDLSRGAYVVYLFTAGLLIAPMTLTHVHENHLFYGGLLGIVAGAMLRSRVFTIAFQVLFAVNALNLIGRYAFGGNEHSSVLVDFSVWWGQDAVLVIATCVAIVAWVVMLAAAARRLMVAPPPREADPAPVPVGAAA